MISTPFGRPSKVLPKAAPLLREGTTLLREGTTAARQFFSHPAASARGFAKGFPQGETFSYEKEKFYSQIKKFISQ